MNASLRLLPVLVKHFPGEEVDVGQLVTSYELSFSNEIIELLAMNIQKLFHVILLENSEQL